MAATQRRRRPARDEDARGRAIYRTVRAGCAEAYSGSVDEFVSVDADGSFHLTNVCEVGGLGYGRDGSYHYYISERVVEDDPKGLGPAIMAGLQMSELSKR